MAGLVGMAGKVGAMGRGGKNGDKGQGQVSIPWGRLRNRRRKFSESGPEKAA